MSAEWRESSRRFTRPRIAIAESSALSRRLRQDERPELTVRASLDDAQAAWQQVAVLPGGGAPEALGIKTQPHESTEVWAVPSSSYQEGSPAAVAAAPVQARPVP
jgi:hypothetical protein